MTTPRRAAIASVACAALWLVAAGLVSAKEGTEARLDEALPLGAQPGDVVTIGWVLGYEQEGAWFGISMCDVNLFVHSAGESRPLKVLAGGCGAHYTVSFTVPAGGIDRVEIGLGGMDIPITGAGTTSRAAVPTVPHAAATQSAEPGSGLAIVATGLVALFAAFAVLRIRASRR